MDLDKTLRRRRFRRGGVMLVAARDGRTCMLSDQTLRLASVALGVPLTDPQPLGGSTRSLVLRCQTPSGPVVVKRYPDGSTAAFAREVDLEGSVPRPAERVRERLDPL